MSTITAMLRECHRLRKHLRALKEEIERGPRVLKAQEARLAKEESIHKEHHETILKLKLKQRDDEGTLRQTETRLAKLEQQFVGISVKKEYEAKQSEIRQAKDVKGELEDAVLASMTTLEEMVGAVPRVEAQWAAARADFATFQEDAKARLERLKADEIETRATLAAAEATIPLRYKSTYDYLVKAHGPDAMAGMKDKVCEGCHTGMTDQRAMELGGGGFVLCSSCGKMLYPIE